MASVLVTGGAGYIGSHTTLALIDAGWSPVIIDNLVTGKRELVPDEAVFIEGDISDSELVRATLKQHDCRAVLHFAGSTVVPESVSDPLKYYGNNTCASRSLIESVVAAKVGVMIFCLLQQYTATRIHSRLMRNYARRPSTPMELQS
ncbi:MAG: UDP-glucose 4-epimerase [Alphaproteobacteria bacterium]|jgi:UDP-glucose 4-epimerase